MPDFTEIVFILDRSGSMAGLEADTVGGFNSLIAKQKKEDGQALVSTVLFNEKSKALYDRVDLNKIQNMTADDDCVCGCTALLDAIADAIHHIGNVHKYAREEDRPSKTLFIITTDGMENSSTRYTYEKVQSMIERQKNRFGWEFIFLGANIDAVSEARRFGIDESCAANYHADSVGTTLNYEVLSEAICHVRSNKNTRLAATTWKEKIDNDYASRK